MAAAMAKIQTNLWFDNQAEEAARFYTALFKNSGIRKITYYPDSGQEFHGKPADSVMLIEFHLNGQEFTALNGGPVFKLSEAVSIVVNCDTQEEVDFYWEKLALDGGEESPCGWLKNKFGLSWQIVPVEFSAMAADPDSEKSKQVSAAVFTIKKQ